jgi:hypothetical protein
VPHRTPARPVIPNGALADAAGSLGGMHHVEEDFGHEMTLQEKEHPVVTVVRQVVAGRRGRRR